MKYKLTKAEVIRFAKYSVGGTLYFWVGYAVFAVCYSGLHWDWLWAKVVCDAVGWSLNYVVQRFWAFADRKSLSEMQHASRYVFIETVGFVIDYLIIWGLKHVGISPYLAFSYLPASSLFGRTCGTNTGFSLARTVLYKYEPKTNKYSTICGLCN